MKQDVYVGGMPKEYVFTEAEIVAMPVLSTSQNWDRRDSGVESLKIETFNKRNGQMSISIHKFDGIARWTDYGSYTAE